MSRADWYIALLGRHRWWVLAAGAVAVLVGAAGASRLALRASMQQLLPSGDVGAHALDEARRRIGNTSTLVVAIRSPDAEANLAYAASLTARIEAIGPPLVERATWRLPEVRAFF